MNSINRQFRFRSSLLRGCLCGIIVLIPFKNQSLAQTSIQQVSQSRGSENFRKLFSSWFRRKPPLPDSSGGSRGPFCLLSPPGTTFNKGTAELWSQRPSFFWIGRIGKISVREADTDESLWHQSIPFNPNTASTELQVLRYGGPALEAGKRYEWQIFEQDSDSAPQLIRPFSILGPEQRGPITRAWMQEQIALARAGATFEEQMLRRGEFVLEHELSADFYQALFLAAVRDQLDEEGRAIVGNAVTEQCGRNNYFMMRS